MTETKEGKKNLEADRDREDEKQIKGREKGKFF